LANIFSTTLGRTHRTWNDLWRVAAAWLNEKMPQNFSTADGDANSPSQDIHSQMMGQRNARDSASSAHSQNPSQSEETMPLADFGLLLKEWAGEYHTSSPGFRPQVFDWATAIAEAQPVSRSPWEGFEDVGFRTILPMK